jgi:hypothetical protein
MAKTYIDGTSCKAVTGQFGEFFNMSFNLEKLQQYANEKGYVNVTMSKRKEAGQYGDTHYFTLNDWKPEGDSSYSNNAPTENKSADSKTTGGDISVEDIPF